MGAEAESEITSTGGNGWRAALAGLVVGGVSFIGSWHPSIWADESAMITASQRSVADLWRMLGTIDLVHSFYYFTMHFWVAVFGISELSLRLPSAIVLGVAGACVYLLGVRLGGRTLGLWSAVVFAILPRAFWTGVEARALAMSVMFAAALTLVLVVALDTGSRRAWASYSLVLLLGILTNLYVGFLVPAHLLSIVLDRTVTRDQRIRWAKFAAAPLVLLVPFVLEAFNQRSQIGVRRLGAGELAQQVVFNQWFLGDTPTTTTGLSITSIELGDVGSWWAPAGVLYAGVAWLLIAYALYDRSPREISSTGDGRSPLVWQLPSIALPTAVIGLYSVTNNSLYNAHYLTFAAPAAAMLVACGLLTIRAPRLRTAALVVLVLAAIPIFVSQRQLYGKNGSDWVSVAEYIEQEAHEGDGVYFAPRYALPGRTVGRTTRMILTSYPDPFTGLIDFTLLESAAEVGDLVGTSRRLDDSVDQLADLDTVWVITRLDYPRAEEDDAFLTSVGFREVTRWEGVLDEVVEYRR